MLSRAALVVLMLAFLDGAAQGATTHEEEVVRSTYATVSFLCELGPLTDAALGRSNTSQSSFEKEIADATPQFEITHVQTGTIASIKSKEWISRFTLPDETAPFVLAGNIVQEDYSDPTTQQAQWHLMKIRWDVADAYTPEVISAMEKVKVDQAVAMGGSDWTTPAKYTRYATFEVTVTFQGRTVGPYTASFFFGRDEKGNEIVAPQDSIVSGQILWDAVKRTAYPADLIRTPRLRQNPLVDHWIQTNTSSTCSSARSDLCCSKGMCLLPKSAVARDVTASPHR